MTPALKNFLISQLRRISYKWPAYSEAWRRAKGMGRGYYMCRKCGDYFRRKDCQLDHVEPVVPVTGWDGLEGFVSRLFCPADNLQILCKVHHAEKTAWENVKRKELK